MPPKSKTDVGKSEATEKVHSFENNKIAKEKRASRIASKAFFHVGQFRRGNLKNSTNHSD